MKEKKPDRQERNWVKNWGRKREGGLGWGLRAKAGACEREGLCDKVGEEHRKKISQIFPGSHQNWHFWFCSKYTGSQHPFKNISQDAEWEADWVRGKTGTGAQSGAHCLDYLRDARSLPSVKAQRRRELDGFKIPCVSRSHLVDFISNQPQEPKKSFSKRNNIAEVCVRFLGKIPSFILFITLKKIFPQLGILKIA